MKIQYIYQNIASNLFTSKLVFTEFKEHSVSSVFLILVALFEHFRCTFVKSLVHLFISKINVHRQFCYTCADSTGINFLARLFEENESLYCHFFVGVGVGVAKV